MTVYKSNGDRVPDHIVRAAGGSGNGVDGLGRAHHQVAGIEHRLASPDRTGRS